MGGALFAWRGRDTAPTALLCLVGFAAGGVLTALDLGWAGLVPGLSVIGLCTAPLLTVASARLQVLLPEHRCSEGFSVTFAVQAVGFALGVRPLWSVFATAAVMRAGRSVS